MSSGTASPTPTHILFYSYIYLLSFKTKNGHRNNPRSRIESYEELWMTNGKCHASEVRVKSGNKVSHLSFGQSSKLFLTGPLTQGGRYAKRHVGNVASSVKKLPTQSTVKLFIHYVDYILTMQ